MTRWHEPVPDQAPDRRAADTHIMEAIREGDTQAFGKLIQVYWEPLVRYAAALVDGIDAEDIVQETFLRLWERRAAWVPSGSVAAYLYRITRNRALNERKRRAVRLAWLRHRADDDRVDAQQDQAIAERELRTAVENAISALPRRRREALILIYHHELSYSETGEVMGISRQTVANQVSAALAELRRRLRRHIDG